MREVGIIILLIGLFIIFISKNTLNNNEINDKNELNVANNNEIFTKNEINNEKQIFNHARTVQERRERIDQLVKELLKESEEWKESLTKEEEKLAQAQKNWISLANKLDTTHLPNRIKLDIGGTVFATSKSTLTAREENFFGTMFSGRYEIKPEADGSFFIDRDPRVFHHILNFMRDQPPKLDSLDKNEIDHILDDAEFYQMNDLVQYIENYFSSLIKIDSLILKGKRDLYSSLTSWLPNKEMKLQYRGSRDGLSSNNFRNLINDKGSALILIQDKKGFIFGGYSPNGWNSNNNYYHQQDSNSFLFTLTNPYNIPPTKYLKRSQSYNQPFLDDLLSNNLDYGSIGFPNLYSDTTGYGCATFTGDCSWSSKEVEIFLVS